MTGQREVPPASDRRPLSGVLVPLGLIGFCAVVFWMTTQFDRVPPILKRGIQPSDFPQLVIALIAALAVLLLVKDRTPPTGAVSGQTWSAIGCLVGFTLVAQADLFLGLGLFSAVLTVLWGERRPWAVGFVGLAVPTGVFFLFDAVFEVRFPRGVLTTLWYG